MEDNLPKLGTKSNECTVDAFLRYFPIHFCTENKVPVRKELYGHTTTQREIRSRPEFDFVEVKDLRFLFLCAGLGTFILTVIYILICLC